MSKKQTVEKKEEKPETVKQVDEKIDVVVKPKRQYKKRKNPE